MNCTAHGPRQATSHFKSLTAPRQKGDTNCRLLRTGACRTALWGLNGGRDASGKAPTAPGDVESPHAQGQEGTRMCTGADEARANFVTDAPHAARENVLF